jgi:peptidoglycan-associated lipoprotein
MRLLLTVVTVGLTSCTNQFGSPVNCGCGNLKQTAPGSEADLVANVGDRVFFAFNKSNLSPDAEATVKRQAAWLARYPKVDVLIAGNADEQGTETYNLALGNRRADFTRDYLVAQGIAAARIQTISYGKDRPVAAGHDDSAHQQNRNAITSVVGNNPQK